MPPRRLVLAFGLLLAALLATSPPQRVGDAREYLAMGMNLARLQSPALSPADRIRIETRLDEADFRGLPLEFPQLRDAQGRQDFFHFWFYSALAVPGLWLTDLAGLHPNDAFTLLNLALFFTALWIASRRMAWWFTAAVFCSPVLWWLDKSHTEAFTSSLLAIAFALLRDAPWWSMVCLGAAATQNPPVAALLVAAGAAAPLLRRGAWRDARFWTGAAAGSAIALLHPAYYEWRWGLPTPQLLQGTSARIPTLQEFGAVLWDPNIGVLFHAPLLVVTFVGAGMAVAVLARRRLADAEIWLAAAGAGIFLLAFAQTTNFNNGATPGMSRYAVWLIPLTIPIFQRAAEVPARVRRGFILLSLASSLWSVAAFRPQLPENYCTPTRLASALWSRWPALDNPLPEIFVERLTGGELGLAPAATPDCAKVLLIGGQWPVPCPPQAVPPACARPSALCYANRSSGGYGFVKAARPSGAVAFARQGAWAWDSASMPRVERILQRLRWRELRLTPPSTAGAMVRAAHESAWTYGLQGGGQLLLYVSEPGPGASLTLRLPGTMVGSLIDPDTGGDIRPIRIDSQPWELTRLNLPASAAVVVMLHRLP
jgi:hypothetical protein